MSCSTWGVQTRGKAPPSPGTFQEHPCAHASLSARQPGLQVRKLPSEGQPLPHTWPGQQDGQRNTPGSPQGLISPGGMGEPGGLRQNGQWPESGAPGLAHLWAPTVLTTASEELLSSLLCISAWPREAGPCLQALLGSQEHTRGTHTRLGMKVPARKI